VTRAFRRLGDTGKVRVTLPALDAELLRHLGDQLQALLATSAPGDPVHDRLYPRVYLDPTEEDAEQQWQRYLHDDLVAERLAAVDALVATLDRGTVDDGVLSTVLEPDEVDRWLASLNDARLALGARLGVTEERDLDDVDEDADERPAWEVYDWLTWMQSSLLGALGFAT
jgi:hypothetical protein